MTRARLVALLEAVRDRVLGCPRMTSERAYGCTDPEPQDRCSACLLHEAIEALADPERMQ